tara:strand:- start:271 stop:1080 length:810 start_codon:yes stop_codon:yes gene_type:complete
MKLIAELCQNHNGSIKTIEKMVDRAKYAEADICKLQSIKADSLTSRKEYESFRTYDSEYKRFKELELSYDDEKKFIDFCGKDIIPMTTIFSTNDYDYYNSLGYDYLKLSGYSMEAFDYGLKLDKFNFKHLVFSTSSLTLDEIKKCISNLQGVDFTILYCVCLYPTPADNINLSSIQHLKTLHDKIGFSDHSIGVRRSKDAIFQGIDMLERHFTILNKDETRDGKVSLSPQQFKELSVFSKYSKDQQYRMLNIFNDKQKFNHTYYKGRFK